MTETIEQLCQRIQDARGYLVCGADQPHPIGKVLDFLNSGVARMGMLECQTVIISETDFSDFKKQADFAGVPCLDSDFTHFYRVIAE